MLREADSLLRSGRYSAAESAYTAVLRADSNSVAGRLGLGTSILHNPNLSRPRSDALRELGRAVRLAPHNPILHVRYGEALLPWRIGDVADQDTARLTRAIRELGRALELSPDSHYPRLGLYLAFLARNDSLQARHQLRRLHDAGFFPAAILDFAHDLLITVDSGGILVTGGDLDGYAALALQAATGERSDVTVVMPALLGVSWYARSISRRTGIDLPAGESLLPRLVRFGTSRPNGIYLALTLGRNILEHYQRDLSLEGFAYRVTKQSSLIPVNRDRLETNLTRRYRVPDFLPPAPWPGHLAHLNRSYAGIATDCAAAFLAHAEQELARDQVLTAGRALRQACSFLIAAGRWDKLNRVLDYWLKIAPNDLEALRLRSEYQER